MSSPGGVLAVRASRPLPKPGGVLVREVHRESEEELARRPADRVEDERLLVADEVRHQLDDEPEERQAVVTPSLAVAAAAGKATGGADSTTLSAWVVAASAKTS